MGEFFRDCPARTGVGRGVDRIQAFTDMQRDLGHIGHEVLERFVARHEIGFAVHFQQHAEALTTSVNKHGEAMRELLTQRLSAFEQMFSHGGTELAERISRDSSEVLEPTLRSLL